MAWAMQDESVKVQMFRFIDVLPMLATSEAVTRHLHEYFDDVRQHLPAAVRLGLAVATPRSLAGRAVAIAARRNAMGHARRFIAGTNATEVLAAAMRERKLQAGLHARHAGRGRHQRERGRPLSAGLPRPDRGIAPDGQRLARGAADRPRRRSSSCRGSTSRSSSRRSTASSTRSIPTGTTAARRPSGCASCCGSPASSGRSSTSTWSRIAPRI